MPGRFHDTQGFRPRYSDRDSIVRQHCHFVERLIIHYYSRLGVQINWKGEEQRKAVCGRDAATKLTLMYSHYHWFLFPLPFPASL
jgi:hypothetical protein